jgi:hypothetical protein
MLKPSLNAAPQTTTGVLAFPLVGNPTYLNSEQNYGCGSAPDFHRTSPTSKEYEVVTVSITTEQLKWREL